VYAAARPGPDRRPLCSIRIPARPVRPSPTPVRRTVAGAAVSSRRRPVRRRRVREGLFKTYRAAAATRRSGRRPALGPGEQQRAVRGPEIVHGSCRPGLGGGDRVRRSAVARERRLRTTTLSQGSTILGTRTSRSTGVHSAAGRRGVTRSRRTTPVLRPGRTSARTSTARGPSIGAVAADDLGYLPLWSVRVRGDFNGADQSARGRCPSTSRSPRTCAGRTDRAGAGESTSRRSFDDGVTWHDPGARCDGTGQWAAVIDAPGHGAVRLARADLLDTAGTRSTQTVIRRTACTHAIVVTVSRSGRHGDRVWLRQSRVTLSRSNRPTCNPVSLGQTRVTVSRSNSHV